MFHILTDSLLEDHLNCNTKSYLRLRGQSGQATDYSALCSRLDARHRSNASQRLAAQSAISSGHFGGRLLRECLTTGDEIILDAVGVAGGMETHFDGLQRIPGDSSLGPYRYRPIRFWHYLQPNSVVHLLLAFDALILGQLQGVVPDDGILICGSELRRIRVRLRTHLDSLVTILTRLRLQSASNNEPPLVLNRHCEVCEFKQLCRSKALEEDNLTLLRGMTLKEMTRHNSKGIFSVKQLSFTFRPRRPAKRRKQQFHHNFALQALALRENKVHVHGTPIFTLPPTRVYFDIEGLPDRGFYYLIGVLIVKGQSHQYHSFWADDEKSQVAIFEQLASLFTGTEGRVFHYGNYELKALRKMLSRVSEPCRETLGTMLTDSTNILPIISSHIYFPTTSNSLKEVASFLGFRWTSPEASGLESVVWREQWEDTHDEELKVKLLQYNRDDCFALQSVTDFVASIAARELTRSSHLDEVVYMGDLQPVRHKHKFGKAEFCLPDFEFVNRCAYFDYQRDKVFVRSGKRPNSGRPRRALRRLCRAKINKRVEVRCKRCPACNSRRLSEGQALSMRTIDIKFFGGGVKKWVTSYSSWMYHCHKCGKTFRHRDTHKLKILIALV